MKLITDLQQIETIIEQNPHILDSEAEYHRRINGIPTSKELEKYIKEKENINRNITVGIIGTVNAGKSSLVNSLFFSSKRILPTDAIAMTAALTVLEYGETSKLHIELYSEEDIDKLRKDSDIYKEKEKEYKKKKSIRKKDLARMIKKERPELVAAYELYSKITESPYYKREHTIPQVFDINTIDQLHDILLNYISADWKYTQFTKSIKLTLPTDELKGMRVIDTPGLNDIVPSREQRTYNELRNCDVILLISRAGHFFTEHDKQLLHRIYQNCGIRSIHVLASQVDTEIVAQDTPDNSMKEAINIVSKKLQNVIRNLSSREEHLKGLLANTQIIPTSYHISEILSGNISEENKHTLERLKEEFPHDFREQENNSSLQALTNITTVQNILKKIQVEKEDMLQKGYKAFLNSMQQNINRYKDDLKKYITNKKESIHTTDIQTIQKEIEELTQSKQKLLTGLQTIYKAHSGKLQSDLLKMLERQKLDIEITKYIENDPWYYLFWRDKFIETYPIYEMMNKKQSNIISLFYDITEDKIKYFKGHLFKEVTALIDRVLIGPTITKNTTTISNIIDNITIPFHIKACSVDELNQGKIYSENFDSYKSLLHKQEQTVIHSIRNQIERNISNLLDVLEENNPVQDIITSIEKHLFQLEKDLNNKDEVIKTMDNIANKLSLI